METLLVLSKVMRQILLFYFSTVFNDFFTSVDLDYDGLKMQLHDLQKSYKEISDKNSNLRKSLYKLVEIYSKRLFY